MTQKQRPATKRVEEACVMPGCAEPATFRYTTNARRPVHACWKHVFHVARFGLTGGAA